MYCKPDVCFLAHRQGAYVYDTSGIGQVPRGYHPKESQLEYPHRPNHKKGELHQSLYPAELKSLPQTDEIHLLFNACKTVA